MDANRARRDAAGVGPYAKDRERLVALSSLGNWHVAKGEPDIRGWEVRTVSGRQLGNVRDLLIDREAGEAVMLDIDLPGTDRHAVVPIRVVQIDRAARVVLMDSAELDTLDASAGLADQSNIASEARTVPPTSEVVVDRRPVVEETVVRRREAVRPDDSLDEHPIDTTDMPPPQSAADRRRGERRRIDRMGTDL
jgi:hypothetical protein